MLLSILIVLNLIAISLESVESIGLRYSSFFFVFEMVSVSIFGTEYVLRIWASAASSSTKWEKPFSKRLAYMFSFTGLVDLLAILPSLLSIFVGSVDLRWLRVLRMVRLLKISHYSSALEDLVSAIKHERASFTAAIYLLVLALFFSSSALYIVESDVQPNEFGSIPETMWWSIITLTTVGYGDASPVTAIGKVIAAITALMGVMTVALLTGIVANAFANQVQRRNSIFEAEIVHALADGEISEDEAKKIEALRKRYDLSDEHAEAIIEIMTDRMRK
ncbi:MAG: potassium channel protein [Rhodobacteraceae bacterium]|nr:MAG: potassium channel protein [Paracoccaceae bacterium]